MRLAALKDNSLGCITKNGLILLSELGFSGSMLDFIITGKSKWIEINQLLKTAINKANDFDQNNLAMPLSNPPKIVAIGLNYIDHASESKMELPKSPLVFAKFRNSITGPTDSIKIPTTVTKEVDYEVELGVVIGKTAKNVSKEEALDYVFGYTIINDVSARDLQFGDGQWVRGKSLDTFCPTGPFIVTADEIKDPQNLELGCKVNGETLQHDNTKSMIFGVAEIISKLSHTFTFEPGDIIATGTPSGVGFSRKPPIFLKNGDIVSSWIKGIGELLNPVVEI